MTPAERQAKNHSPYLFPDVCCHPLCEEQPIFGVNRRFVCKDHIDWAMKPIREIVRLVDETFRG